MTPNHLFTCLLAFLTTIVSLQGQTIRQVPYFNPTDSTLRKAASAKVKSSVQSYFAAPTRFDKEAKKAFEAERSEMADYVAADIAENALFDDVLAPFVQSVHTKIVAANPDISATHVILTREPVPNAFSVGDGTLVVYTGLLSELENEDQLAFVLCHEIAHFTLQHAAKQLVKEIERFQSKEFKEQVKKLKEAEFNQSELLEAMYRNVQFKSRFHRRDLERQADSLALHYFLKTDYDPTQAQRLMELFETIDEPLRDSSLQLQHNFGCAAHPFQQKWLEKGGGSIWETAIAAEKESRKVMSDSLSTHPDSEQRLLWLNEMTQQLNPPKRPLKSNNYSEIRFVSALENANTRFLREQYDKAIYTVLLYQKLYPETPFLKDILSLSLNGLFVYSKNHNLSAVLSQTSPYYEDRYNELLNLLNNLRLSEMTALQSCIVPTEKEPEGEYGLYAAYRLASAKEDKIQAEAYRKKYLAQYAKGRFVPQLRKK